MIKTKNIFFIICVMTLAISVLFIVKPDKIDVTSLFKIVNVNGSETKSDLNILKLEYLIHNYSRAILRVGGYSIPLFVHDQHDFISKHLSTKNYWENEWLSQLISFMKIHQQSQLFDIECNLGVYTLLAATLSRSVIAIDANKNNTDRLVQSIILNNLQDKVTIIGNAISNERKEFSMSTVLDNIGGQSIIAAHEKNKSQTYRVKSILLNDLIPIAINKQEFIIKMDIEGSEIKSFTAAADFFSKINIIAILMEWEIVKKDNECYTLICFLMSRNFRPYSDFFTKTELKVSNFYAWPVDIVWRKI